MFLRKSCFFFLQFICLSLFAETSYLTNTFSQNLPRNEKKSQLLKTIEGWGKIRLGLSLSEVKKVIKTNYHYLTLKENGLSDIPEDQNRNFLETYSQVYVNRLQLQFDENERLYLIRIKLSSRFFNFTDLLNDLKRKYGLSFTLNFSKAYWENSEKKLELYKDNTIIYLDKQILKSISSESRIETHKQDQVQIINDTL